ncbi:Phytochrome-like protein cph2 [Clostridium vincentii]|uniref:Phytochrome-like protein cph2 n=2 Tax=Clostridium vincentii TaxID=52704 RepID=A0A2T0BK97_9CLOT|nr:Phytochrome-like protein cph2 [Clostridium vincentii]
MDTLEGDVILYPVMPESEGSNILELKDAKGNYALQDEINLVNEQGEGYTTGYWINPNYNDNEGYKKITFVKKFEKYNWYIGTGEYVDDVEKDIQQEILDRVDVIRFGSENDNYIFIDNFDGVELCNGVYKEYVDKNIWDLEDKNGTKIIQEQITIAKNSQDGGFMTHYWKTPDTTDVFQKMTFVRAVPEWNWVIGSGVQFDELVNTIQENESKMKEEVMNRIKNIVGIVVLVMLMAFIIAKTFVKRIQKSLDIFFDFLNNASWNYIKIDEQKVGYSEFKDLGIAINLMINERDRIEKAIRRMNNELNVRVQEGSKELEELNSNIDKKLDEKTLELRNLLNMDGLTQMYNHKYMFERLENEIIKAIEDNEKICIIMFDIDYFKNINDNYGHQCGDQVLTRIASILKEQIREVDIVGRYGGEEFIAIITNADMETGYNIVEGIRKKIIDMKFKEKGLSVTISGGIVEYCSQTAIEMVKLADDKLYEAKRKGRNRIQK